MTLQGLIYLGVLWDGVFRSYCLTPSHSPLTKGLVSRPHRSSSLLSPIAGATALADNFLNSIVEAVRKSEEVEASLEGSPAGLLGLARATSGSDDWPSRVFSDEDVGPVRL